MWIISLFLAFLLISVLQMWVFSRFGLRHLTYRRQFSPDTVNEGDETAMIETIRNEKLLPVPWLRIEAGISSHLRFEARQTEQGDRQTAGDTAVQSGARQYHRSVFSLAPYAAVTRRHHVTCAHRGYYRMRTAALTAGDLLGIGRRHTTEAETDSVLVVYPRTLPIEDVLSAQNSYSGDIVVRRWIMDDPFFMRGVREYTGNEPYSRINWKATARTGALQVHEYDYTADIRLLILLNIDTDADQWSSVINEAKAEHAISIAATLAQYMLENGIETGFATNAAFTDGAEAESYIAPQSGESQLAEIFATLAKITMHRTLTLPTLLQSIAVGEPGGMEILLISSYLDEGIEQQIAAMRTSGFRIEILDPQYRAEEVKS